MPYFSANQGRIERGAKIMADITVAALLAIFSVVFFGWVEGLLAFVLLEVCLLAVDWLVPNDDMAGTAIR